MCEAEMTTPATHSRCRTVNESVGVARCPSNSSTSKPWAAKVVDTSRANSTERFRVSWATAMRPLVCPVSWRWRARPCALSAMVRELIVAVPSGPITPRRPPVPNGMSSQNSRTNSSVSSASSSAATAPENSPSAGSVSQRRIRPATSGSIRPSATACSNRATDDCTGPVLVARCR